MIDRLADPGYLALAGSAAAAFITLWTLRPVLRETLRNTFTVGLLGLVGLSVAHIGAALEQDTLRAVAGEFGIVVVGVALIRLAGIFLFRLVLPAAQVTPPRILEDVVVVLGYIAWLIVRLRLAGANPGELVTASAVVTAVIAFSMQDTLGNILGGIALQLDDSLEIGQWIKVDDTTGIVVQIGWRSTTLRTRNGELVVLPNSILMKNRFLILGRVQPGPEQWRRWVWFDCPNDVPPARVVRAVRDSLRRASIGHVSAEPAPDCVLMGFANGVCQYAARYWLTDLWKDDPTDSEVRQHVHAALRREGIPLALPQYRLRTVAEDEYFAGNKYRRDHDQRVAAINAVDLFAALTDEERSLLADRLVYAPYAAGDVITRQGDTAHWLYLVTGGEADVWVQNGDGTRTRVATLTPGRFFGEMALLTGAPRRATVTARTDIECYRLDKAAFADLMQARPAMAEDFTHILAERQHELDAASQSMDAAARAQAMHRHKSELLDKIRRFFSL